MRRLGSLFLSIAFGLLAAGCPKGQTDYNLGKRAETLQDYDAALTYYQKALRADPYNANYKIKLNQIRFEAGELHVKKGLELRKKDDLSGAAGEFQRAETIDPSSPVAEQELNKTLEMIAEKNRQADAAAEPPADPNEQALAPTPPQIKPLSRAPINLRIPNVNAKVVFDTIGKLAGLTVIYDPEFAPRTITTELNNVTLEQALDIVSLQSKAFWKPVTENIIFVIPDQVQKRRDYEEQVVRTFYLSNTVQPQELTEIVTGLRQLLDLKRMAQLNSQNAFIVRDTPDKLLLAEKMIHDIDKARPEVVVQVEVLQARTDRLRELGVLPGQSATVAFTPSGTTATSGTTTTSNALSLDKLKHLSTKDYSVTLPGATANAVLTDTYTKIIQNPEIRSVEGQRAVLRVGDRIPIATGSFGAGIGVGGAANLGSNLLVNTQFTYQDVGVNIDLTPRVHPNHEVSMKVMIEVSSVTGTSTIGGLQQPIISQRKIEHDIRLKEGEVSILGGLFERTESKTLNGWPGLAKVPFLRYLVSDTKTDRQENEVLILLIPRIVRLPEWTKANLQPVLAGTETNVQIKRESEIRAPSPQPPHVNPPPAAVTPTPNAPGAAVPATGAVQGTQAAKIRFEPQTLSLKAGQTTTVGIVVENVNDLFSIPMLLQYNPAVISVEEVQHGGFLSGGTQEIAIVHQDFKDKGQSIISATRKPNTQGVSGSGTLIGIVVKALAPGLTNLSIVQVNAKDSQQKMIPLITSEATVEVQP